MKNNSDFYQLSAIKGIQAGKPYYAVMCPVPMVVKLLTYTDNSLSPEMRVQRVLNKNRIPEMKKYILENRNDYVFSALTASVDGELEFIPADKDVSFGQLKISVHSRMIINDGQHRRAALEAALAECPDLRHEDISIILYYDLGLKRSQQMFSDLNRYAIRPTKSLNILYDNRDAFAILIKECILQIPMFNESVENEKTSLSNRSKELFTLSSIFHSSKLLLSKSKIHDNEMQNIVVEFWNAVSDNMKIWQRAKRKEISPEVFRREYICAHAITLKALGAIGNFLIMNQVSPSQWYNRLSFLKDIQWEKSNQEFQGLVMINDRISSSQSNQKAFTQYLLEKSDWSKISKRRS